MHRHRLLVIALLTAIAAIAEQPSTLGSKFNKKRAAGKEENVICMTHPAQLDPCVEQIFNGIEFRVAYSGLTHRVSYLYTDDLNFRTAGGLRVCFFGF